MATSRRVRYWVWIFQAFFKRHYRIFALGLTLGIVLTVILLNFVKILPKNVTRETIGIVGDYYLDKLPTVVLSKLSMGLTTVSPDGQPLPGLASSWNVSPDLSVYTFYLTPQLQWSDGKPLKGDQIDYHFKDATMKALSTSTVQIILKESYTPLPVVVSRPLFRNELVGVGPYSVSSFKTSGDNVTELNLIALPKTERNNLTYRFYPTEETALTAWELGEVKKVEDVSILPRPGWNATIDKTIKTDRFVALFFNLDDPGVQDKSFRQALAYAIKTKTPPETKRALGPISPDSWTFNPNLKPYDYDRAKAIQLISKIATSSASIHLTISTFPSLLSTADSIKKDWQDLGIKVDTQVVSSLPDTFQILLITQATPPDPDQYNLWHSTQTTTNLTHLKNPKVDKLLEDGRKTEGMAARKKIYFDFQKTITEDLPAIFLYHPITYTINRP